MNDNVTVDPNRPRLKRDWIGRKVRLCRRQENGVGRVFDAGTILIVEYSHGGLHLMTDGSTCPHCGLGQRFRIRGVLERNVDLLQED